jgi:GPH family glycoside/pentoside/hexuronide:cation symporter
LGYSMVGDICDEDELKTGTRSEGSFYAVYWWFIKMGRAFASFVTGVLLVFAAFDARQNKTGNDLQGAVAVLKAEAEQWSKNSVEIDARVARLNDQIETVVRNSDKLQEHFDERMRDNPELIEHLGRLIERTEAVRSDAISIRSRALQLASDPPQVVREVETLFEQTMLLKQQTPKTLFRLRLVEIGLPLALSIVSIVLTLRYPLTEARCYEIKQALQARHAELAKSSQV